MQRGTVLNLEPIQPRSSAASLLDAVAAIALLAGCGAEVTADNADPGTGTETRALRCLDEYGYPTDDPICPFPFFWNEYSPEGGADISHTKDPALCFGPGAPSVLAISVDSSNRYRTLALNGDDYATSWGSYGPKQFSSKPTCAMREAVGSLPGFVLAGRATDGQIFAAAGHMNDNLEDGAAANPTADEVYAAVDTGNNPTLASCSPSDDNCGSGQAVMFFFSSTDNRTIIARRRPFPYASNSWSGRINGPALAAGTTASGPPGVAYLPGYAAFHIVVRSSNGSLFETYYSVFSNAFFGNPVPGWAQLPITGTISGDPSLSYSPLLGYETVVFRSGDQVKQTSGLATFIRLGELPVLQVQNNVALLDGTLGPKPFVGSPASWAQAPLSHLSAATFLSRINVCTPPANCFKLVITESIAINGLLGP